MELRHYLAILQRRWWMLLLGVVVAAGVAYGVSKRLTPVYRAQATLLLNLAAQPSTPTYSDVTASQALTKTYAQLITARPTLEEAARRLGNGTTYKMIRGVAGADQPQTELLHVSFDNKNPTFAATVVNTVSDVFAERITQAQLGSGTSAATPASPSNNLNTVYIAEPAVVPQTPVSPRVLFNTILAAIGGLLVATAVVALLEYLDDTIQGPEDLEALDLTLMGMVQRERSLHGSTLNLLEGDMMKSRVAEGYRQLRTNLDFAGLDAETRSLVVSSAQPGEGKTTTAANLAIMLAEAGRTVILVDADLRRPSQHKFFSLPNRDGLTSALLAAGSGNADLPLQLTRLSNLRIMTSGPLPPNPAELLSSPRMQALMASLSGLADIVIYDSPPSIAVADAAILSSHVDAVLLVIDTRHTRLNAVRTAIDHLSRSKTRILGAVLNKVGDRGRGYKYYYYYSQASAAYTQSAAQELAPVAVASHMSEPPVSVADPVAPPLRDNDRPRRNRR